MEAVVNLMRPINDSELFYRTEFIARVPSETDHLCSCVECGFHKSNGADSIVLTRRNKHQISCNKCSNMYATVMTTMQFKLEAASLCADFHIERQEDPDQLCRILQTPSLV